MKEIELLEYNKIDDINQLDDYQQGKQFIPAIKKLRMKVKACDNIRIRSFKVDVERIAWKKIRQREQLR